MPTLAEYKPDSILLLRQDNLGDLVVSMPFIRWLRSTYPNAKIEIVLSPRNAPAAHLALLYCDKVHVYDKKLGNTIRLIALLRSRRYDLAIDLMDKPSRTSRLILQLVRPRFSVGFGEQPKRPYSHPVPALPRAGIHIVDRTCELSCAFGYSMSAVEKALEYPFSETETTEAKTEFGNKHGRVVLGIVLTGSTDATYWGSENFSKLIVRLHQNFPLLSIALFGKESFEHELRDICKSSPVEHIFMPFTFRMFAQLLHECDAILTPNTVSMHLASAWRKPATVLFQYPADNEHTRTWYPLNTIYTAAYGNGFVLPIAVDDVYNAICELFEKVDLPV